MTAEKHQMEQLNLSNEDRKYLGLTPIGENWETMRIKDNTLYFDGDIIRKMITHNYSETWGYSYSEFDECIKTAENRTIVLPKTERGKPKKLNYTAVSTFRGIGVYLRFADGYIIIGNVTTQKTFHSENVKGKDYKAFNDWFDAWKKDTNEEDLRELEEFRTEKRQRQKYKEGDYFCFKYNRRNYGFGKIIIDVAKRRKDPKFKEEKNYGLNHLMGPALVVKIYHKLSPTKDIDIKELENCPALPAVPVMDNNIYYNEYKIIGHSPVTNEDLNDSIISVSPSITGSDLGIAYLQYGLIYKEIPLEEYKKHEKEHWERYRNEAIGFSLFVSDLEDCINEGSNLPYFSDKSGDLRNPENAKDKEEIFKLFGLDASLNYEENLKLAEKK